MDKNAFPTFTKAMKHTYKILMPMMAQPHFDLIAATLNKEGYDVTLLKTKNESIPDTGLKYTHNDICYPAILVIGQFIEALKSNMYDVNKVALLITQTGGGCRASNYIFLIRKALITSGYPQVPVISVNASSLNIKAAFYLSPITLAKAAASILYGDFILCIFNQARTYEKIKNKSEMARDEAVKYLTNKINNGGYFAFKKNYKYILALFNKIKLNKKDKPRVGIVGEIYMKYSALGNRDLEEGLINEGMEPVVSGMMDFLLYCLANQDIDGKLYNIRRKTDIYAKMLLNFLVHMQKKAIKIIKKQGDFIEFGSFDKLLNTPGDIIGKGVKMGEGWLLTAEMVEHIGEGVNNIVCTQPFGCLPNHIVAKGVVGKIKAKYPDTNIVFIDYDPSASKINQDNRIKLMTMNALSNNKKEKYNEVY